MQAEVYVGVTIELALGKWHTRMIRQTPEVHSETIEQLQRLFVATHPGFAPIHRHFVVTVGDWRDAVTQYKTSQIHKFFARGIEGAANRTAVVAGIAVHLVEDRRENLSIDRCAGKSRGDDVAANEADVVILVGAFASLSKKSLGQVDANELRTTKQLREVR